ncbi:MAG TPA: cupin domain-containing protein [Solirubrobacteraceae bacterium]
MAWLDALRRADADALAALTAPDATWQGIRPEWVCHGRAEVLAMFLARREALADLAEIELLADDRRAVLHLRAPSLRAVDERFHPGGVYIAFALAEDGRVARVEDHARRRDALPLDPASTPEGVAEAPVVDGVPQGPGWFVVNAAEARWLDGRFGAYTAFEGEERFEQIGVNIGVLAPGQPACFYHREDEQEDFLVLRGEALLLVEGEERRLRQWDFVHCPPWTNHVFVGAGDGPCALFALGGRTHDGVVYPVSELALRHRAGVEEETTRPAEAYAAIPPDRPAAFDPVWLG